MITDPLELIQFNDQRFSGIEASEIPTFLRQSRANPYLFFVFLVCLVKSSYREFKRKKRRKLKSLSQIKTL